jgi:hypothetical protein
MSKTPQPVIKKDLDPVVDSNGVRRCAWANCTTPLSRYNEHIVCGAHTVDYAINYLPIAE